MDEEPDKKKSYKCKDGKFYNYKINKRDKKKRKDKASTGSMYSSLRMRLSFPTIHPR